jgi:Zn-dependent M28 family amino/carboxypeptidase
MKFYLLFIFILVVNGFSFSQINEENLQKHVYFLASDKLKGRETGKKGSQKAARYIAKEFAVLGLQPKGERGYFQDFNAHIKKITTKDSIRKTQNVIGFLDNKASKTIVIGAHYDHLGKGTIGSSRDTLNIGKIHNGADDNASGVAGLLELARYFSTNDEQEKMNILFIAFGSEEWGLIGSKYFVEHPTIPLDQIHWMLNMDMIGRYNPENGLAIIGHGTSDTFIEIFEGVESSIRFYTSKDGRGGSDQTSFYDKKIPVLFFHTGGHDDYHKSTDDAHKVDYAAMKAIVELELKIIQRSMSVPVMNFIWTN